MNDYIYEAKKVINQLFTELYTADDDLKHKLLEELEDRVYYLRRRIERENDNAI